MVLNYPGIISVLTAFLSTVIYKSEILISLYEKIKANKNIKKTSFKHL